MCVACCLLLVASSLYVYRSVRLVGCCSLCVVMLSFVVCCLSCVVCYCILFNVRCLFSFLGCSVLGVCCLLSVACGLLLGCCCSFRGVRCVLFVVCCWFAFLLLVVCWWSLISVLKKGGLVACFAVG